MEERGALTLRLNHLLRCRADGNSPVIYRSCTERLISVGELVEQLITPTASHSRYQRRSPWQSVKAGPNGGSIYTLQLLKKVILAHFQLYCASKELRDDIRYAFGVCSELCSAIECYNCRVSSYCTHPTHTYHYYSQPQSFMSFDRSASYELSISFADISEVVINLHSNQITCSILEDPRPETLLSLTRFETSFLRAFLGTFATFTSLLGLGCHKSVFVSEEAFLILAEGEPGRVTWLDCLIPGAQSEVLRKAENLLLADLWSRVSSKLVQHHFLGSSQMIADFVASLRNVTQQTEMEYHSAAVKCLQRTISSLEQHKALALWDTGFQSLLASSQTEAQKGYKVRSGTSMKTTQLLLTQTAPHCHALITLMISDTLPKPQGPSAAFAVQHVNLLRHSQMLCGVLDATLTAVAVFLAQGLSSSLASWNLKVLARLLFVEGPTVAKELDRLVLQAGRVCSPQCNFPPYSGLHLTEWSCRRGYSTVHQCKIYLKEAIEGASVALHNRWTGQCRSLLTAVFPSVSFWKTLGKRNRLTELSPSSYCDTLKEQLIFPLVEAAEALAEEPQKAFVVLTVSILMNEYRRIVTSYKKAYRPGAGRQLLVDHRHLLHWLTSPELGLHPGTVTMVSSLPLVREMEQGLLTVCGTADRHRPLTATDTTLTSPSSSLLELQADQACFLLVPAHKLAVFTEPPWHSSRDWLQCIAS